MEFRPCIDIHNGKVKQIVGASLKDKGDEAKENFVSDKASDYYAKLYKSYNIPGGHVILLNSADSPYYDATKAEAVRALQAYPGGLMVGGGINDENAGDFLDKGASHVIVTSFVFKDGRINYENLDKLTKAVGKENIVLDLSCKSDGTDYYVVTDRWQKMSRERFDEELFNNLSNYCDEFLVHAADVEGKSAGIDKNVLATLGKINHTITYAGGISSYADIYTIRHEGNERVNFTVGSRLDIFGGNLSIEEIIQCTQ